MYVQTEAFPEIMNHLGIVTTEEYGTADMVGINSLILASGYDRFFIAPFHRYTDSTTQNQRDALEAMGWVHGMDLLECYGDYVYGAHNGAAVFRSGYTGTETNKYCIYLVGNP